MQHGAEHPLGPRSRWFGWSVVGAGALMAGVLMGVVGGAVPAGAAKPAFSSERVATIVARAGAAMTVAGSVSASGGGSVSVPGVGTATISEVDYAGPASGSQVLKTTARHLPSGIVLPSASVADAKGVLYAKGNVGFWVSSAGVPDAQAVLVAGKWVHIPSASSVYGPIAADLTMSTLVRDLFDAKTYHKGRVRIVDNVAVIPITYTNGGADSGRATCDVTVGGKHLPVSWTISGLRLRFSSWGVRKGVTAPQGAIELPNLPPSTSPSSPTSPGGTVVI